MHTRGGWQLWAGQGKLTLALALAKWALLHYAMALNIIVGHGRRWHRSLCCFWVFAGVLPRTCTCQCACAAQWAARQVAAGPPPGGPAAQQLAGQATKLEHALSKHARPTGHDAGRGHTPQGELLGLKRRLLFLWLHARTLFLGAIFPFHGFTPSFGWQRCY